MPGRPSAWAARGWGTQGLWSPVRLVYVPVSSSLSFLICQLVSQWLCSLSVVTRTYDTWGGELSGCRSLSLLPETWGPMWALGCTGGLGDSDPTARSCPALGPQVWVPPLLELTVPGILGIIWNLLPLLPSPVSTRRWPVVQQEQRLLKARPGFVGTRSPGCTATLCTLPLVTERG